MHTHAALSLARDKPAQIQRQHFQNQGKSSVSNPQKHEPPDPYPNPLKGLKGDCKLPTACKNTFCGGEIGQCMGKSLTPREKAMSGVGVRVQKACPTQWAWLSTCWDGEGGVKIFEKWGTFCGGNHPFVVVMVGCPPIELVWAPASPHTLCLALCQPPLHHTHSRLLGALRGRNALTPWSAWGLGGGGGAVATWPDPHQGLLRAPSSG